MIGWQEGPHDECLASVQVVAASILDNELHITSSIDIASTMLGIMSGLGTCELGYAKRQARDGSENGEKEAPRGVGRL